MGGLIRRRTFRSSRYVIPGLAAGVAAWVGGRRRPVFGSRARWVRGAGATADRGCCGQHKSNTSPVREGSNVFFILISHLAVNLANPIYHLRYRRERFHWLANAVVPALGLAIDGYVLYIAFSQNLLAKPFKSGGSIVWLSLAWAILGMTWAAWASARRPAAHARQTRG